MDTFNRPEHRTASLHDDQELGLISPETVGWATAITDIEHVWATGAAFEVFNPAFPARGRVSARAVFGDMSTLPITLVSGRLPEAANEALLPVTLADGLGIDGSGGSVSTPDKVHWVIVGSYVPLHAKAPSTVLVPSRSDTVARSLSFTTTRLAQLDGVTGALLAITETSRTGQLSVERSSEVGPLDQAITGTVRQYGAMIVVTTLATSMLVSALMVHTRRQEFGRRRALGATRGTIIALVMVQGALVVLIGATLGLFIGCFVVWIQFGGVLRLHFLGSILTTAVCGSALAQIPSAVIASVRDPVRVLRTP